MQQLGEFKEIDILQVDQTLIQEGIASVKIGASVMDHHSETNNNWGELQLGNENMENCQSLNGQ